MLKKIVKNKFYILGFFIILISIGINFIPFFINKKELKEEEIKIDKFFETKITEVKEEIKERKSSNKVIEEHYNIVVEIPKINLNKGIYDINSKYNNVNYNIEILKESDMPNITNGNFILASHNGNANISYFDKLSELNINDNIFIYYNNIKYNYKIVNFYEVDKTGTIEIKRNLKSTVITLITCKKNSNNKQLVYIGELLNKQNY